MALRLGYFSCWVTLAPFPTLLWCCPGRDLSGKASPAGHGSNCTCPSAQLCREGCGGHPRGRGERPVPVCAEAQPRSLAPAPSSSRRRRPHATLPLPTGTVPSGHHTARGSLVRRRQNRNKSLLVPQTQRKAGSLNQTLLLAATVTRNQT